ncbi:hypothetical protein TcCL_ESM10645 [Trypanosoma cruzi]|nr:hypothetical protein TcCL_ESM10645 [Trypanosoma cruzi]
MGGNACCYSVLPGLRCRTHAVCADGHSSGAEYGSMCVAHGDCATRVFCWEAQRRGASPLRASRGSPLPCDCACRRPLRHCKPSPLCEMGSVTAVAVVECSRIGAFGDPT